MEIPTRLTRTNHNSSLFDKLTREIISNNIVEIFNRQAKGEKLCIRIIQDRKNANPHGSGIYSQSDLSSLAVGKRKNVQDYFNRNHKGKILVIYDGRKISIKIMKLPTADLIPMFKEYMSVNTEEIHLLKAEINYYLIKGIRCCIRTKVVDDKITECLVSTNVDFAPIFTETFNNICPETYFFYVAEINGQYISFESEPSWIRPTPKLITSYKEIIEEAKAHGIPVGKFLFFQFEENGVTTHQLDMSKAIHFTNPKSLVEHVKAGGEISYFVDSAFCFYIDWSPA